MAILIAYWFLGLEAVLRSMICECWTITRHYVLIDLLEGSFDVLFHARWRDAGDLAFDFFARETGFLQWALHGPDVDWRLALPLARRSGAG